MKSHTTILRGMMPVLLILTISLLFSNCYMRKLLDCEKENVHGSGIIVQEIRAVRNFHGVKIVGSCQVQLTVGPSQSLILEGEDNVLPLITTTVTGDGILVISNIGSYSSNYGVKAMITMAAPRHLEIVGSGSIYGDNFFRCDDLTLMITGSGRIQLDVEGQDINNHISGSGDIHLRAKVHRMESTVTGSGNISLQGRAHSHTLMITGSGNLDAYDFPVDICWVTIAGSGSCYIYVRHSLYATVTGSGTVHYKGNPQEVVANTSAGGRIIKH
jgi:hypothetical protein